MDTKELGKHLSKNLDDFVKKVKGLRETLKFTIAALVPIAIEGAKQTSDFVNKHGKIAQSDEGEEYLTFEAENATIFERLGKKMNFQY